MFTTPPRSMDAVKVAPLLWLGAATVVAAVVLHNVFSYTSAPKQAKGSHPALLEGASSDLDKHFAHASGYVSSKTSISNEEKLVLYAFFKQATAGNCAGNKPSMLDFVAKAKWYVIVMLPKRSDNVMGRDAWQGLAGMPSVEAKKRYLEVVSSMFPGYAYDAPLPPPRDDVSDTESDLGGDMSLTPLMSQVVVDKTTKEWQVEENAFHFAKTGQVEAVQGLVANATDINQTDDEGRTMLHWAVDRNQVDVVATLLAQHANVNATDNDGMTPLHYAVSCEHVALVDLLLEHGADPEQVDVDGESPFAAASTAFQAHITESLKRF
ncbi:hypothetical protein AaE_013766 [Aphanomyces astaci]|uniref:ACB domain-containing protein n=1 Tax=Aphanomyces astaci TaxID=112090 RepID=A0A6A4ZGR8_APHAT|nr:hypothetical protein AaE_013766 [Aphanomyces astaci]